MTITYVIIVRTNELRKPATLGAIRTETLVVVGEPLEERHAVDELKLNARLLVREIRLVLFLLRMQEQDLVFCGKKKKRL